MEGIGWWVLGGVIWLVVCWLALVYLSAPLTLIAVAAGLVVGTVLAAVGYLRVYRGAEDKRVLIRPVSTMPRGRSAAYRYWDNGWPGYLSGQVERDIAGAVVWPGRQVSTWWKKAAEWASDSGTALVVALPAVPPPMGFLVAVTAGVYGAWLALAIATEAVAAVPRLGRLGAIAALRAGDASVRWWHGAAATCPSCRWVTRLPAYRCSGSCQAIHRDLRPGRLGVWWRRCHCRARLPTMVLRAAPTLTPVCPACGYLLHKRVGAARDGRIAVSGGPAAGKTQLLISAMGKITDSAASPPAWELADVDSATWLRDAQELMARSPRHEPEPTEKPELLTLRGGAPPRERYVHVADVGGEHFMTAVNDPALRHLGTTRRHLLVLDPMTIPSVRDRIDPATLTRGHNDGAESLSGGMETSSATAELPYRVLVAQLNRFGARTRRCSLAVVITKADLLATQSLAPDPDPARTLSHRLRAWLCAVDLRNLVETAEHDFGKVRYFLVGLGVESTDPVAPFAWLLRRHPRGAATP